MDPKNEGVNKGPTDIEQAIKALDALARILRDELSLETLDTPLPVPVLDGVYREAQEVPHLQTVGNGADKNPENLDTIDWSPKIKNLFGKS